MKNRSDVLNDLGKFMAVFGWVTVVMSVLLGVVVMGAFAEVVTRQSGLVMGLLVIIIGSAGGIIMSAMGQIMQYLVAVERRMHIPLSDGPESAPGFEVTQSVPA
ncbi:MAG TPA: hypothetical protein VGL38_04970 [bacterium]